MKHFIIVKFIDNNRIDYNRIEEIFSDLSAINGISGITVHRNCINRDNRWDAMIEIEMTKETLPLYDESRAHRLWKEEFSKEIAQKAIFDCE